MRVVVRMAMVVSASWQWWLGWQWCCQHRESGRKDGLMSRL